METATRLRQCPNCFGEYDESMDVCPFCGYAPVSQSDQYPLALAPGRILAGRYILGRVLGQGGFGITYLAWDAREKVRVAIKEFFPDSLVMRQPDTTQVALLTADRQENFRFGKEQFLAEAKTLAQFVDNPNIVSVYSYFEENGTAYFAMEYVEGESLKSYLKEKGGRLSWEETLQLLTPVMDALQAVHAKGIIHRDIKPDNIFITEDGHTKLLDFGSARYSLGDRSRSLDVVLTAGYAPKEQYARHSRQGPYTDVYSLAACFYACITGMVPTESVERTEDDDLPLPSARGAKLPAYAEDAILKGLSIKAENRWQTMADFKANLLSAAPENKDNSVVEDSPTNTHKTVNGNNDDDPKTENVVLDREGSGTQNNSVVTTDKNGLINSIKKLKRPQIAGIIAAVVVICVFAGYMVIPFKATEKSIQVNGKEVGLYTGTVVAGKPSGEGRMEYTDGSVYDGDWEKGQRSGQGSMSYSNKNMYTGDWMADVENGEGTMNYASGDVYKGDWLDGKRSGEGHMEYANGDVYEGGWLDDQRSGEGVLSAGDGIRVYTGEWVEDEMEGPVVLSLIFNEEEGWISTLEATYENGEPVGEYVYTYANGDVVEGELTHAENQSIVLVETGRYNLPDRYTTYEGYLLDGVPCGFGTVEIELWDEDHHASYSGEWRDGHPAGKGVFTFDSGETLLGEWSYNQSSDRGVFMLNGEINGFGMWEYTNGPYCGEYRDGEANGFGYKQFDDGNEYIGYWKDNSLNGQGKYEWENGDTYEGEYVNGDRNGWGTFRWANGDVYEGEWVDDVKSGKGTCDYAESGNHYEGEYANDQRNGWGTFSWADGDVYEGNWVNGLRHGQGTYYYAESGNRYEGEFENGKRNGWGTFYWASGDVYEGQFVNDQRTGQGTYYWPNGDWFEGEWVDGKRNGQGTYHWADGTTRTGTWKNSEYVG